MDIISEVCRRLSEEWCSHYIDHAPEKIYPLVYRKTNTRWNIHFFEREAALPFAFAKITTHPDEYSAYMNELEILNFINDNGKFELKHTIPNPIYQIMQTSAVINIEKALHGLPLFSPAMWEWSFLCSWEIRARITMVIDWWESLIRSSCFQEYEAVHYLIREMEDIADRYMKTFPDDKDQINEIKNIIRRISESGNETMTLAPVHGDFWQGNLFLDSKRLQVFDWERGRKVGIPIFDIFLFCTTLFPYSNQRDGFYSVFIEGNWLTRDIQNCIHRAACILEIKEDLLRILFEMFLYEMSTAGMKYFHRKIVHDQTWLERTRLYHKHKQRVISQIFS